MVSGKLLMINSVVNILTFKISLKGIFSNQFLHLIA